MTPYYFFIFKAENVEFSPIKRASDGVFVQRIYEEILKGDGDFIVRQVKRVGIQYAYTGLMHKGKDGFVISE
jgi:hypothetical protein